MNSYNNSVTRFLPFKIGDLLGKKTSLRLIFYGDKDKKMGCEFKKCTRSIHHEASQLGNYKQQSEATH